MPTPKPFFSIIIPALNEAKYLPHLLEDLSHQTYRDFEVIIVDGHSDDDTVAKAKKFSSSLPSLTIVNSPRRHVCTQRNLGAKQSKAETLIFCDADNRLPPYFLQGVKYRHDSHIADILSFWLKPDSKNPSMETIATAINLFLELQNNLKPSYLLESLIVIPKQVFERLGTFDESVNYAEGKSLIRSASQKGFTSKVVRDPTYTYSFRRLRKFGALGMASRITRMELASLVGKDPHNSKFSELYPMLGGSLFNNSKRAKNRFISNIAKILKNF